MFCVYSLFVLKWRAGQFSLLLKLYILLKPLKYVIFCSDLEVP